MDSVIPSMAFAEETPLFIFYRFYGPGKSNITLGTWLSNSGQTEGKDLCCFRGKSPPVLANSQMSLLIQVAPWKIVEGTGNRAHFQRRVHQYESTSTLCFKFKPFAIPAGWLNDPDELSLNYCFRGVEENMRVPFQSQFSMPNPVPVLVDRKDGLWLIDSVDGNYHFWEAVADSIFEIYERNLAKLLSIISESGGLAGTKFRALGIVSCGGIPNCTAHMGSARK